MAGTMHTEPYRGLVKLLVAARLEAGLTQVQLAERLGKPQSYISKIERGERRIDVIEFVRLAHAFGREPGELLNAVAGT